MEKESISKSKNNKVRADENSAPQSSKLFDYEKEVVLNLKVKPDIPKKQDAKKGKKNKKQQDDELDIPFQKKSNGQNKTSDKTKSNVKNKNTKSKKQNNQKVNLKKKKILKITKWTTLTILFVGGLICFLLSPIFNIKNVEVYGNNQISADTIISLSGIQKDKNIFAIKKNDGIKNILNNNAYIESVKISRKMCDTIQITIEERYTTFIIALGNSYAYINNQGYVLEINETKLQFPEIIGYTTSLEEIRPGNRLNVEDLNKFEVVLQIMTVAESNGIDTLITKINIADDNNYSIEFESEGKIAYLGNSSNLSTKMMHVKKIMELEQGNEGEIFVNRDLNKKNSYFREKV